MKPLTAFTTQLTRPAINPIIVKELRSRMRGPRAYITLTAVLIFMALISYALYQLVILTSTWSNSPLSPQIGQTLFAALVVLEMLLICFITPAVTAGAISSEHENLTYEMLLTTPLNPTRILWGKLASALSYIFLLVFAAIPIGSLVFVFGGVAPRDMLKALVVLVCTAIMLGTIGIFMSTWLKRTGRATIASYLIVLGMLGVPTLIYTIIALIRQDEPPRWLLIPSPINALFSAIAPSTTLGSTSIGMIGGLSMLMGGNLGAMISTDSIPRPLYHYTLPLYGLSTMVLYLLATRLIRPARQWHFKVKDITIGLVAFFVFIGVITLAFESSTDRYESASIFKVPTPLVQNPAEPKAMIFEDNLNELPLSDEETAEPKDLTPQITTFPAPSNISQGNLLLSFDELASIYSAAILQAYTINTPKPGVEVGELYLVQSTDLASDPIILPIEVQNKITDDLDQMPFQISWIEKQDITLLDNMDQVAAIITLGHVVSHSDDGAVEVMVDLFFSKEERALVTYILQKVNDEWQIIDFGGVG